MKILHGIGSKAKRLFLFSSEKEDSKPVDSVVVDSGRFQHMGSDFGSKEESFFDSKAWLDSDCEDDFYSVNGDFTPSRGNTPNHQIISPARTHWNNSVHPQFPVTSSENSPTDGKKKLLELLQETFQGEHVDNNHVAETNGKFDGTPTDSELRKKHRTGKNKNCCFPGFRPSRDFNDGMKQMSSPAQ